MGIGYGTLHLKSLSPPLSSVWSKTILNSGVVGVAGADPHSCKMETSFFMSLALRMPIFDKMELQEKLSTKIATFYKNKSEKFCFRVCSVVPFYLNIGIYIGPMTIEKIEYVSMFYKFDGPPLPHPHFLGYFYSIQRQVGKDILKAV